MSGEEPAAPKRELNHACSVCVPWVNDFYKPPWKRASWEPRKDLTHVVTQICNAQDGRLELRSTMTSRRGGPKEVDSCSACQRGHQGRIAQGYTLRFVCSPLRPASARPCVWFLPPSYKIGSR